MANRYQSRVSVFTIYKWEHTHMLSVREKGKKETLYKL